LNITYLQVTARPTVEHLCHAAMKLVWPLLLSSSCKFPI